ncbi:hypothetical protein BS297_11765 [Rhodococcus erythropolis]|uniref:Uncharacterized protein n=1 Tax=Rhodococcus erythropolis TaxID=1833 RepID=A0A5N5E4L9_RHOER|nr:hypothetical protein BS297_11765 [Rhodococcus erythropolis]
MPEEPQSARGDPGSRDGGSTKPGGGPVDRPSGSFDDEETISGTEETAMTPAQPTSAESVVPPYEGRQETAQVSVFQTAENSTGPNIGGAGEPVNDPEFKAPPPEETPRGRTASPADEQPASTIDESTSNDSGGGPAHQPGVGRAEDK